MTQVVAATRSELDDVAATLGSAFADDPLLVWMTGRDGPQQRRIESIFRALLRPVLAQEHHLVHRTADGAGAAVWHAPDQWRTGTLDGVRMLPALVRACGRNLLRAGRCVAEIERLHPGEPSYYLEMLGTRQERQGQGLGSALLQPMLARCDAEGRPAYLESSNPRNIAFYHRHGFDVREEVVPVPGAPVVTTMWREPARR